MLTSSTSACEHSGTGCGKQPTSEERERAAVRTGNARDLLMRYNVVTGATMAFRREHVDLLCPIPSHWVHDGWIALILSLIGPCAFVTEPLIRYRQHAKQQIGGRKTTFRQKITIARSQNIRTFRQLERDFTAVHERAERWSDLLRDSETLSVLAEKIAHCVRRAEMRSVGVTQRLGMIQREFALGGYRKFALGWKSMAQDLVLCRTETADDEIDASTSQRAEESPSERATVSHHQTSVRTTSR